MKHRFQHQLSTTKQCKTSKFYSSIKHHIKKEKINIINSIIEEIIFRARKGAFFKSESYMASIIKNASINYKKIHSIYNSSSQRQNIYLISSITKSDRSSFFDLPLHKTKKTNKTIINAMPNNISRICSLVKHVDQVLKTQIKRLFENFIPPGTGALA